MTFCVQAGWDDVPHLSAKQKEDMLASYPEHERAARSRGEPMLGSGAVFPILAEKIMCEPQAIPKHWPLINAMDFGWDHPFGAVGLAWDRDSDVLYVTKAYRESKATPVIHVAAVKPWGHWVPWAWPHDGLQHDKGSGDQLKEQYASHGLNMLAEQASHEKGGNGVEAGLFEMLERMLTGRFKVFSNLNEWFEEFKIYHRKDGKIVKLRDDLMSATRYAVMMRRYATTEPVAWTSAAPRAGDWMGA